MKIEDFKAKDKIKIVDVNKIKQGDTMWENGDVVEVKNVDEEYNRLDVWRRDKYLSEFIYEKEMEGIEPIK